MRNVITMNSIKGCLMLIAIIVFLCTGMPVQAGKTHILSGNSDSKDAGGASMNSLLTAKTGSLKEGPETYRVKKGDSLWKIGKKYSISVKKLKKLNGLKSSRLKPGQELILVDPNTPGDEREMNISAFMPPQTDQNISSKSEEHADPEAFLMYITQQTLGIPYKFGSNSNKATDCSGYVQRVFRLMGIQLPRSAREQFNYGSSVEKENLSVGDMVFFRTYASFPSHVGIYLGNNLFVHASVLARKVTIDNLNTPYYIKRFIGARRLFDKDSIISVPAISTTVPQ